jgi:ATP/maltotriose-dependent transcriptional regulator MalT
VVVVEAAGGYGKSVLAAELVDAWGALAIWVLLEPGGVSARLLIARLRAAVARAGLTDAAAAMATVGDDPAGAIEAMLDALRDESYAIVIDDVQHAAPDAAALINRVVDGPPAPLGRAVVLGRYLPAGLERLHRAGPVHLGAADLALRPEETLELCRRGFGLDITPDEGRRLDAATGGWTAAAVLAASRSKVSAQPLATVAPDASAGRSDAIQSILEEALGGGARDRRLFARIAAPPLLDAELLGALTGEPQFLQRALAWGLPLYRTERGWWLVPDPVREHLAALGPPDSSVLVTAASHYARNGAFGAALRTLLGARQPEAAAQLLDDADPWVIDTVDAMELLSAIDELPDETIDRHARGILKVARCLAGSWMMAHSNRLTGRLKQVVDPQANPEFARALEVELLVELVNGREQRECEERARAVLARVDTAETLTRARALTVLGQSLCARRDPEGRLDAAALREAADCLARAFEIQIGLGNKPAAATITIFRALDRAAAGPPARGTRVTRGGPRTRR